MTPDTAAVLSIGVGGLVLGVVAWAAIETTAAFMAAWNRRKK